jgi:hypothetical protein
VNLIPIKQKNIIDHFIRISKFRRSLLKCTIKYCLKKIVFEVISSMLNKEQ